jgi:hypothetical protein
MKVLKFESMFHTEYELNQSLEMHCINEIKECNNIIKFINSLESWDDDDKHELEYAQYRKLFYQTQLNKK